MKKIAPKLLDVAGATITASEDSCRKSLLIALMDFGVLCPVVHCFSVYRTFMEWVN